MAFDPAIAQEIADIMFLHNYTWTIEGETRSPNAEEVQETLDKMVKRLYTEQVPSQMHAGHLIVHRWKDDKFDVYLQMGQI